MFTFSCSVRGGGYSNLIKLRPCLYPGITTRNLAQRHWYSKEILYDLTSVQKPSLCTPKNSDSNRLLKHIKMSQDNGELRAQSYVGFESKLRPDHLMCNIRDYVLIACTLCSSYHSADRAQAAQTRFPV